MHKIGLLPLLLLLNTLAFSIIPGNQSVVFVTDEQFPQDTSVSKINIYNCYGSDSVLTQVIKFDALGRINAYFRMDNTGKKPIIKTELKYLGNTRLVASRQRQIITKSTTEMLTAMSEYYEYDSLNRMISKYSFDEDTSYIDLEEYLYNADNNIYKITLKRINSEKYVRDVLIYDNLKRLIKKDTYTPFKKILYSSTIQYDGNKQSHYLKNETGIELKEVDEYKDNSLSSKKKYKVDDNDNSVLDYEVLFFYNTRGFLSGEEMRDKDELLTRVSLIYFYK